MTMKTEVTVDVPRAVKNLLDPKQIEHLNQMVIFNYGVATQTEIRQQAPVRSGHLRKSFLIRPMNPIAIRKSVTVFSELPYARVREEGTNYLPTKVNGRGVIMAKNVKFLKWIGDDGKPVFRKWVYQEGSKYFSKGVESVWKRRVSIIRDVVTRILKGWGFK